VGGGGEARGGRSLLGDVHGMCMSAGTFFQTVGGQYSQTLGMHEIALVCVLALEGLVILTYHLTIIVSVEDTKLSTNKQHSLYVAVDVIIFTFYSDQLTIDVETGIVTK
jgi:hypothetical protein